MSAQGNERDALKTRVTLLSKEQVRIEDYQAYDLLCVREHPARDIAAALHVSSVTVRVRAFRVRRVISAEIRRIVRTLDLGRAGPLGRPARRSPGEGGPRRV